MINKRGVIARTTLVIAIVVLSLTLVFYMGKLQENNPKKITGFVMNNETNESEIQQSPFTEKTYSITSYFVYIFLFTTISVLIVSLLVRIFIPKLKNYT
ncbi:hypothetical protein J4456_01610 [Candidatus Pacearchaeota archaeon]|nr:hypothetical protein [Candidatus Pacearchaeota archaeon]